MSFPIDTGDANGSARRGQAFQNVDGIVFSLSIEETLKSLLAQEDTDLDMQITINDEGPKAFPLPLPDGKGTYEVKGTYMLSNLLQELTLAQDAGHTDASVPLARLTENPVKRLSRRISDDFWDMLTRRIDASSVERAALDPKDWTHSPRPRVYVPHGELEQLAFYERVAGEQPEINLDVQVLPEAITPELLRNLNFKPGLLAIAMEDVDGRETEKPTLRGVPFVVPGGRFNEFYGWDSYFIALGLLSNGRADLAKGMVTNFCFCIKHYGKILNSTRSYYLCRSQPPFLTDMALRTYERIKGDGGAKEWLRTALLAAIKEYSSVWTAEPRFDRETGLSRYRPEGLGVPMETEPGHFNHLLRPYAEKYGMSCEEFAEAYTWDKVKEPALDEYFMHDRAVRESGHDTSYRLEDRCANLATVDLNCLLYKYETDIGHAIATYFDDKLAIPPGYAGGPLQANEVQASSLWTRRAERRKEAIQKYCWEAKRGMFFDYDTIKRERTGFESATTLYALWAGVASQEQAASLVTRALPKLEALGGLASTTKESVGELGGRPQRQWDFPYGWAPHQILAWEGLQKYGFQDEAARLAYRWLYMVTKAFRDYNGVVVEKYDVTRKEDPQRVDAEYGNQGLGFKGVAKEGFGWVNASYVVGLKVLDDELRKGLEAMIPYDEYKKGSLYNRGYAHM